MPRSYAHDMFSFSCTPTATRSNAHPWQCKRLIALFFPLFFLVACAESSMAKYVLCSAMTGTIVMNGAPDGLLFPSHLAAQGFYVLRARAQLREITNVLLK